MFQLKIQWLVIKMSVNIGNNNRIKNAIVGNNNSVQKEEKKANVLVDIIITIIVTLFCAGIIFYLGWN